MRLFFSFEMLRMQQKCQESNRNFNDNRLGLRNVNTTIFYATKKFKQQKVKLIQTFVIIIKRFQEITTKTMIIVSYCYNNHIIVIKRVYVCLHQILE